MSDPWAAYAASIAQASEPAATPTTNHVPAYVNNVVLRLVRGICWADIAAEIEKDRLAFEAGTA